ncbi:MAG: DUF484 family protein [Xanthomonadales bacterium]|nr:DUF484 family protein [Xanthomonadales bacterium]
MSESATSAPSALEVASYLRRHPRFLSQFPDLALSLNVPRDEGSATSLASYQLEVLRDKNRELNRRLQELFAHAQENERLAVRTHQLTLGLMRADSAADTLRRMTASLSEDFAGDRVSIVLRQPVAGLEHAEWLSIRGADDAGWEDFADLLASAEPTCGRVQSDRLAFLFQAHAATLQSVAILPLVDRGLLAVGSCDGNRFFPGMGTLFLRMMAEALGVALARFDVATD